MKLISPLSLSLLALGLLLTTAAAQSPEAVTPSTDADDTIAAAPVVLVGSSTVADEPRRVGGVFGGAGFYWVQPFFQNNPAYTVFTQTTKDATLDPKNPNTQTISETARRVDVRHHMSVAPLIWLGWMNDEGFGVRGRGWGFQQGTSQSVALAPFSGQYRVGTQNGQTVIVADGTLSTVSSAAPLGLQAFGDTLSIKYGPEATIMTVTTKLAVQVYDLEAIHQSSADAWSFLASGGARYVRLSQTYNAYDFQSANAAALRTLNSSYDFEGVGPTLAFELRRRIAESPVSIYGQGRGSLVFGAAHQSAVFFGQELRNDDPNPQFASQNRDRALPILDFEAGLEYGQAIGRTWLFGQVGVAGQEWFNAGSASRSALLNAPNTVRPVLGGAPVDSNIAFLGLTFRIGINY